MKSLLLLLLATVAIQATAQGRSFVYELGVWSELNCQGESVEFHEDVPYLNSNNIDFPVSCISVGGVWILYGEPEYNNYQSPLYIIWGCDLKENVNGINIQISSLRFAGSQSQFNEAGYNLYEGETFTKKDLYGNTDIPDLSLFHQEVKSVIIIGESSWQVCEEAGYSGSCACLYANQHDSSYLSRLDVGFYDSVSALRLTKVTSIKKGC